MFRGAFVCFMNSPQTNERTWRDEVIDESLQGFSNDEVEHAFLFALRRVQPRFHTISMSLNRARVKEYVQSQFGFFKSELAAKHQVRGDRFRDDVAWFSGDWQGTHIEVAFLPDRDFEFICLSENVEALEKFCVVVNDFSLLPEKRALIYSEGWKVSRELDSELGKITWDDLTLSSELLQKIRESVETFFASKEMIQSFGFAWKRGILLVGPPGTGKTMVCKAAANALPNLPFLYVRDLRERNQKEAIEAIFKRARKLSPCILVFEDLDSLINDGNRTVFLNEMDGFASNDGLLVIASSNHPGKIDEALLKRPSRFDRVFHLGLPELPERRAFCEKILGRSSLASHLAPDLDVPDLCAKVAGKTDGFTPAYLKEAFTAAALHCAQQGIVPLDARFVDAVLSQVDELKAHLKKVKNPDALAEMRSGDDAIGFRR